MLIFLIVEDKTLSKERKIGAAGIDAPKFGDNSP